MPESTVSLDTRAARRAFNRAAVTYDEAAVVAAEVRTRLFERLELIRGAPELIVDVGAGTGIGTRELKARFPKANIIALDFSEAMLAQARGRQSWLHRLAPKFALLCGDAQALPLRDASVDWIVSNLAMPWCDPLLFMREAWRVIKPGGLLIFSTVGPDTLRELRTATSNAPRVHVFHDMHDLGDALVHTGFGDPVMESEPLSVEYRSVQALFDDLKATGAVNARTVRGRGLTSRATLNEIVRTYAKREVDSKFIATVEVVYGHAWKTANTKTRARSDEIRVPLASLSKRSSSSDDQ